MFVVVCFSYIEVGDCTLTTDTPIRSTLLSLIRSDIFGKDLQSCLPYDVNKHHAIKMKVELIPMNVVWKHKIWQDPPSIPSSKRKYKTPSSQVNASFRVGSGFGRSCLLIPRISKLKELVNYLSRSQKFEVGSFQDAAFSRVCDRLGLVCSR